MSAMKYMKMLTRYKAWANDVVFSGVARLPAMEIVRQRKTRYRNIVHTLNHVSVIDKVFQAHLTGQRHGYAARNTLEEPPLAELAAAVRELDGWYLDLVHNATEEELEREISFEFIGGGNGVMSCKEIILHLVNHGTYHRGFVGDMMYQARVSPDATDLTVFLRDVPQPA